MRSSDAEQVKRVNGAIVLLRKHKEAAGVVRTLMRRFGISRRQAYRYVQKAEATRDVVEIPEGKVVFTVKLPKSVAVKIRALAKASGRTLSAVVTQALITFVRSRRQHGRRRPRQTG